MAGARTPQNPAQGGVLVIVRQPEGQLDDADKGVLNEAGKLAQALAAPWAAVCFPPVPNEEEERVADFGGHLKLPQTAPRFLRACGAPTVAAEDFVPYGVPAILEMSADADLADYPEAQAEALARTAVARGVKRLVLLSGRGEEEAQACERIVQEADVEWTVVRASWFDQNFSEGEFLGMILDGTITLPAADIPEPFIDVNDIADVVVAALTEDGHGCEIYEVTGPRLLTFTDVAREIAEASGRDVRFMQIPKEAFTDAVAASGAPDDIVWLLNYLFETVLDGRNAHTADGVQRALGREPADFTDFARRIAARGAWNSDGGEVAA